MERKYGMVCSATVSTVLQEECDLMKAKTRPDTKYTLKLSQNHILCSVTRVAVLGPISINLAASVWVDSNTF
jgi:hypothetical protein